MPTPQDSSPDTEPPAEQTDSGARAWPASHEPLLLGIALVLASGLLYILTLAPSVMPGDYAEFQMAAAVLGVPHPTGYPLYVLLGKLFTLLPFGDVACRVNLSSAVYMAGATGMLYAVGVKLLRQSRLQRVWWAAGVGAALFALSPTVWSMALVARSYALNALLVGLVVFALISWRESENARWFFASCLFIGLSMVHHGTTYLLLPAYALYLLLVEVERHRRHTARRVAVRWALGLASFLAGFSPILFLVYRFVGGSPYYWGNPSTWSDFFNLLTGGPFHDQVMGYGWSSQLDRVFFGIGELSNQYTPLGIAAGLFGLAVIWKARPWEAGLLTLMVVANFFFAMNYALVGYLYFIPTYMIWGILIALGLAWILDLGVRVLDRLPENPESKIRDRAWLGWPVAVTLALVLGYVAALRYPDLDQSGQTATRDRALALLNLAPQGASLYMDWEDVSVIRFYRMVYGMRPDIALHTGDPSDWPKDAYCDLASSVPVYVGQFAGAVPLVVARDFALQQAPMGWRVTQATNPSLYAVPPCGTCATCR